MIIINYAEHGEGRLIQVGRSRTSAQTAFQQSRSSQAMLANPQLDQETHRKRWKQQSGLPLVEEVGIECDKEFEIVRKILMVLVVYCDKLGD